MAKIKINSGLFFSPPGVYFLYIFASALAIMGFRLIFPGEAVPLAYFSSSWRYIRGLVDFLQLFPALALSALVIPFGFNIRPQERITPFSPAFLQSLMTPIITAIAASGFCCLVSFLALPLAREYEASLRFRGRLYQLAKERAQEHAARGEWDETLQFVEICERVWPDGPEISSLKDEAEVRTEIERMTPEPLAVAGTEAVSRPAGAQPLNVTEALALAETALSEERYFDAHWLASLGGRLAAPGSAEAAAATRLAGRAWNGVNSLAPNIRETQAYRVYRLKREGHEALLGEEWIRSYYIFRELLTLSPEDPDVIKYLAISEGGVRQAAFFIDEIELALGRILTGAVFSLPQDHGRLVMRIASLSTSPDSAYGIGAEIMAFDRDGRPLWSMEAPYAKIVPLALDSGPAVTVLLRAIDRADKAKQWGPEIQGLGQGVPGGAELVLPVSWDIFLLLTNARRGLPGLSPTELRTAAENLGACGYQPQVFEAELLRRFAEPVLFLPLGIFAIVIGWRYRALKRPRYMGVLMLGILPMVFNGVIHVGRALVNNLGILAVVSLGFNTAALFFGIGMFVLLVLALILLAAQHG
jgi:hypothetical protein